MKIKTGTAFRWKEKKKTHKGVWSVALHLIYNVHYIQKRSGPNVVEKMTYHKSFNSLTRLLLTCLSIIPLCTLNWTIEKENRLVYCIPRILSADFASKTIGLLVYSYCNINNRQHRTKRLIMHNCPRPSVEKSRAFFLLPHNKGYVYSSQKAAVHDEGLFITLFALFLYLVSTFLLHINLATIWIHTLHWLSPFRQKLKELREVW